MSCTVSWWGRYVINICYLWDTCLYCIMAFVANASLNATNYWGADIFFRCMSSEKYGYANVSEVLLRYYLALRLFMLCSKNIPTVSTSPMFVKQHARHAVHNFVWCVYSQKLCLFYNMFSLSWHNQSTWSPSCTCSLSTMHWEVPYFFTALNSITEALCSIACPGFIRAAIAAFISYLLGRRRYNTTRAYTKSTIW